jgi:hypothetical protein
LAGDRIRQVVDPGRGLDQEDDVGGRIGLRRQQLRVVEDERMRGVQGRA